MKTLSITQLIYLIVFLSIIFIDLSSSFLTSEISGSIGKTLCGSKGEGRAMIVNSQPTDFRVDLNQLSISVYDITKSSNQILQYDLKQNIVMGLSSEIEYTPIALLVSEECCSESIQIGETLFFYSTCFRENITFSWLEIGFKGFHKESCETCETKFCPSNETCGEDCAQFDCPECVNECGNTRITTYGGISIFQAPKEERGTLSKLENFSKKLDSKKEKHLQNSILRSQNNKRKNIYGNKKLKRQSSSLNIDFEPDLEEYLIENIVLNFQIHENCNNMGQGQRHLTIKTPSNTSVSSKILFTPSDSLLSSPPQGIITTLCEISIEDDENKTTTVYIEQSSSITSDIRIIDLPYVGYHPETDLLVMIECKYHFDPSSENNLQWTPFVRISKGNKRYSIRLKTTQCPDTAHASSRNIDSDIWEVTIVGGFPNEERLKFYNILMICNFSETCELTELQMYSDIIFGGQSLLLDSYGTFETQFGSDVTISYTTYGVFLISTSFYISEDSQNFLIYEQFDWSSSFNVYEILDNPLKEVPSYVVTILPNQNIDLGDGIIKSIKAIPFNEDLFLSYNYENSVSFTIVRSCAIGKQFIFQDDQRSCQECPRGQYKPSTKIGQNCILCPTGTYANFTGATSYLDCKNCTGECPTGASDPSITKPQTLSWACTDPWFISSTEVDLEGSFYINQRHDVLIFFLISIFIGIIIYFGIPKIREIFERFGAWFWHLRDDDSKLKKYLWSLSSFATYASLILLLAFTLNIYYNENIYVSVGLDVENSVATSYPNLYRNLSQQEMWMVLTLKGRIEACSENSISIVSTGFFDPVTGSTIQPYTRVNSSGTDCMVHINIPVSEKAEQPTIAFEFHPILQDQYVYELQVEASTGYQSDDLKKCTSDRVIKDNKQFDDTCDSSGFSYMSSSLWAAPGKTLRGSSTLSIGRTIIVTQKCEYVYYNDLFNFKLTSSSCSSCQCSTVMLFPYAIESVQQSSEFYYFGETSLSLLIKFETDTYARFSNILPLLSDGGVLLNLLITSLGLFEIIEILMYVIGLYFIIRKFRKKD